METQLPESLWDLDDLRELLKKGYFVVVVVCLFVERERGNDDLCSVLIE